VDNGAYTSQIFQNACVKKSQDLTYYIVWGHWNGIVERHIGTIMQTAWTLLLYAITRWHSIINEEFWPFAIWHVCTVYNASITRDSNQLLHKMFTGEEATWHLDHFHVFGSPVLS
jgi:hypothetical protein